MSNFAPYQDTDSSDDQALSPVPRAPPRNADPERLPSPTSFEQPRPTGFGNTGERFNGDVFSTSLPIRPDIEAVLAYIALPPAGPALLLLLETKSDYVRYHAWQSAMVFTVLFVLHLIFSFTKTVSLLLLVVDLVLMAFLSLKAYHDADSLQRYELPYVGRVASQFVDAE